MIKIKLLLVGCALIGSMQVHAADWVRLTTRTSEWKNSVRKTGFLENQLTAGVLEKLDSLYAQMPSEYNFYQKEGQLYVHISCTFDLYRVCAEGLEKLYQQQNRGYNCEAFPFHKEGAHYLLGGTGFWSSNSDLLFLDELHGSWEWVKIKNQPLDYTTGQVYQNSKGLVSLFGGYYDPRKELSELEPQGYFLDWDEKEWKRVTFQVEGVDNEEMVLKGGINWVETEDYVLLATSSAIPNTGWNILEKESGMVYFFFSKNVEWAYSPTLEVMGNQVIYQSTLGELINLNLDLIRQQSKKVGELTVLDQNIWPKKPMHYPLYLLGSLLVGGLVFWGGWMYFVNHKRQDVEVEDFANLTFSPVATILPYSGEFLTTETLDQLLGIDGNSNFDSRRMKRARLINEINEEYLAQKGKELIVREKRTDDKRYVFYRIQA